MRFCKCLLSAFGSVWSSLHWVGCSSYFASRRRRGAGSWEYGDANYSMRFPQLDSLDRCTLSLSIIPSRCLFQTVLQPMRGSIARTVPIGEGDHYSSEIGGRRGKSICTHTPNAEEDNPTNFKIIDFQEDHSPNGIIYWCSSPRPDSSHQPCFAVGSSTGLLTIASPDDGLTSNIQHRIRKADVKAVDWLSTNVIMAGTRASQVLLHDMRSDGSTVRVQHPHGVHSVKKVDESRIAVAGWGNNVFIPASQSSHYIN